MFREQQKDSKARWQFINIGYITYYSDLGLFS